MIVLLTKQELKYIIDAIDALGEDLTEKATDLHREGGKSRELNHYIEFGNDLFSKLEKEYKGAN